MKQKKLFECEKCKRKTFTLKPLGKYNMLVCTTCNEQYISFMKQHERKKE